MVWPATFPLRVLTLIVYGAVVDAALNAPSTYSSTFVTPTLSVAFTVTVRVRPTVDPLGGDVITTVGRVVSAFELFTVTLVSAPAELPAVLVATALNVC